MAADGRCRVLLPHAVGVPRPSALRHRPQGPAAQGGPGVGLGASAGRAGGEGHSLEEEGHVAPEEPAAEPAALGRSRGGAHRGRESAYP